MKPLATVLLLITSLSAYADSFYVLVGYVCDNKQDQLIVTYDGAYNEEGEAMVANKRDTQWDPWNLVTAKDDDHIGSLKTVKRKCRLSDGTYSIAITPSPGNFNVQGRCGAWMTASAIVRKGNRTVHAVPRFENDCHDSDSPIITRVTIKPRTATAEVSTVRWNDFYK